MQSTNYTFTKQTILESLDIKAFRAYSFGFPTILEFLDGQTTELYILFMVKKPKY